MQTWKKIWEARELDSSAPSTLTALMKADGLDTGFGTLPEVNWREFVARSSRKLGITSGSSVFEVGCGAGAFIHDLASSGCRVGGSDISAAQIGHIRHAIPAGAWSVEEAIEIDPAVQFDYVIAPGVFMYFPTLEYAFEVLRRMTLKARAAIAILDVPDAAKQAAAAGFRQGSMGDEEYRTRYAGLDHLYFDQAWMERSLAKLGLNRWIVEDQKIEGYGNSAYRFNVFAWKAEM